MTQATDTKTRPILFNGAMVRAILDGSKTQTRRVIKNLKPFDGCDDGLGSYALINIEKCPYGKPGDLLWVRETWRLRSWDHDFFDCNLEYKADGNTRRFSTDELWTFPDEKWEKLSTQLLKKGVEKNSDGDFVWDEGECPVNWEPSIYMPYNVCRITLEVKRIWVERVQDISEGDAYSEGILECDGMLDEVSICKFAGKLNESFEEPRPWFATLWDSINASRGYGWDSNPWVWCVEFERINP